MTTDDFILLIHAQTGRGTSFIVPDRIQSPELNATVYAALAAGVVELHRYHCSSGGANCYRLTRAGGVRLGQLLNSGVIFLD